MYTCVSITQGLTVCLGLILTGLHIPDTELNSPQHVARGIILGKPWLDAMTRHQPCALLALLKKSYRKWHRIPPRSYHSVAVACYPGCKAECSDQPYTAFSRHYAWRSPNADCPVVRQESVTNWAVIASWSRESTKPLACGPSFVVDVARLSKRLIGYPSEED
jgi:hypothetical protein